IQEERRRGLETSARRYQHATGHIALGEAACGRLGAVHVDMELWIVERLLNTQIHQTRDVPKLAQHPICDSTILRKIRPFDLDVDRRGQTKIENLCDDVGRLKVERGSGKLARELVSKLSYVVRRWTMIRLQGHNDIGVAGAY